MWHGWEKVIAPDQFKDFIGSLDERYSNVKHQQDAFEFLLEVLISKLHQDLKVRYVAPPLDEVSGMELYFFFFLFIAVVNAVFTRIFCSSAPHTTSPTHTLTIVIHSTSLDIATDIVVWIIVFAVYVVVSRPITFGTVRRRLAFKIQHLGTPGVA